jgi:predicted O-methyltransferase YrrM
MRFKLVFLDAGTYDVVSSAIRAFWPRLTPGGLLVLDQLNHEVAPGEARAVAELLPDLKVQTIPNSWMPTAFIEKPYSVGL